MGLKDDVNKECTIEFKTSIADIQNCVLELFDRMARSLNGIPRVENHIGSLKLSAPNDILTVKADEDDVLELRNRLHDIVSLTLKPVSSIFDSYKEYQMLLNEQEHLDKFLESDHSIEEYGEAIQRYRLKGKAINDFLVSVVPTDMILICCEELNKNLVKKSEVLAKNVLKHVAKLSISDSLRIRAEFKQVLEIVQQRSSNSHELVAAEQFIKKFTKETLPIKLKDVRGVKDQIDFLYKYKHDVTAAVLEPAGIIFNWAQNIRKYLSLARIEQGNDRKALEDEFNDIRNAFVDQVQELHTKVSQLHEDGAYVDRNSGAIKKAAEMKKRVE